MALLWLYGVLQWQSRDSGSRDESLEPTAFDGRSWIFLKRLRLSWQRQGP